MLKIKGQSTSVRQVAQWLKQRSVLAGSLVAITIAASTLSAVKAQDLDSVHQPSAQAAPHQTEVSQATSRLQDGVYLYGQAADADQIGSAYLVFESRNERFVGAFYMPHSSFDCVYGSLEAEQLAMTVVDSYGEGTFPYAIALQDTTTLAGVGGSDSELQLEGMHQIDELSQMDQEVLASCIDRFAEQIW